jgi:2-polyprenyl-3-methyl-5-hydroxy-6-metoxy-1,4-benzoquinol methylase
VAPGGAFRVRRRPQNRIDVEQGDGNGVGVSLELHYAPILDFPESTVKEAILEPLLRRMRIRQVLPTIKKYSNCRLLDIGCGWEARLLKTVEPYIESGVGIDFKAGEIHTPKITTRRVTFDNSLPFTDGSFDVVTMLAVLEHLAEPIAIAQEIERILIPGGRLIVTVPSRAAKPVLEFLSYRLKIVSEAEIRDHKAYYNYVDLAALFEKTRLHIEQHRYFQFGMNNLCILRKQSN